MRSSYLARDGALHRQHLRAKFSGYYGPDGCLGVLAWHRQHFKVHGQDETVLSFVLADGEGRVTEIGERSRWTSMNGLMA